MGGNPSVLAFRQRCGASGHSRRGASWPKLFYCYACKSAQGQVPTCKKPQQIHITTGNLIWGRGRVAPVCGSTSNKFYKEY